jgi:hypothetical protein
VSIGDKTRKLLWGRSGNRCAICRSELVIDATVDDDESIVGDECHIISKQASGPRHDPLIPPDELDSPANLILLCRVHHKMVDDQYETYTVELLRAHKENHERWVAATLSFEEPTPRLKLVRVKENIPKMLIQLKSGEHLLKVISRAHALHFENDPPNDDSEVELLSNFAQACQDWDDDFGSDVSDRIRGIFEFDQMIAELEQAGFVVFGNREMQRIVGGVGPPHPFPVAIVKVARATNSNIEKP